MLHRPTISTTNKRISKMYMRLCPLPRHAVVLHACLCPSRQVVERAGSGGQSDQVDVDVGEEERNIAS